MNLSRYTRNDLVWIIERLSIRCRFDIECAMSDLAYEKEKRRIAEAETAGKVADDRRREYIELLRKYEGVKLKDIPLPILEQGQRLLDEANAAERRFSKLIGLDAGCVIVDELHPAPGPRNGGR